MRKWNCRNCGSSHIIKRGKHRNKRGLFQKYLCQDCGATRVGERIST